MCFFVFIAATPLGFQINRDAQFLSNLHHAPGEKNAEQYDAGHASADDLSKIYVYAFHLLL